MLYEISRVHVEDLQEVVNKLRTEIETLRREPSDGE
jgi:hypothetical protein